MGLATTALRMYIAAEPDWEQRRYEIARDLYVHDANAERCVACADKLIEELKKKKEG